jgi:peptidoglycan biosynthesis protein MviN/MurJ (putative lipid II flippase)
VRVAVVVLLLNPALNLALVRGAGMDADGLALATAICAWINLLALLPALARRAGPSAGRRAIPGRLARILCAAVVAVGSARAVWAFLGNVCGPTLALLSCILLAGALYALLAQLLGIPEWQAALSRVRQLAARKSGPEGRRN